MSIIRFNRFIPTTLREWDRVFESLNLSFRQTAEGKTIEVDEVYANNLPPQDASYVTLTTDDSLTDERVLTVTAGELTQTDNGAGSTVELGLDDAGTAGIYNRVTTDSKGRVASGEHLAYTQADVAETITEPWAFDQGITLPKTSGQGIKVDTSTPTFPWHDLLGAISIRGVGATDPSYNVYRGGIRGYHFDTNEEVFIEFHVPHDYLPGSDVFLHFHHSINGKTTAGVTGGTVTGGTVTWGAEVSYSKGHNQAAFSSPITTTVASTTHAATLYQHYITEVQLSAASPSASQLDSDDLEVDGLILVRAYLSANGITVASGAVPAPFLHFVDIHYQSTNVGTKQKAPDFYT